MTLEDESGFDFLPKKEDNCYPKKELMDFKTINDCMLGLEDNKPVVRIKDQVYYKKDLPRFH